MPEPSTVIVVATRLVCPAPFAGRKNVGRSGGFGNTVQLDDGTLMSVYSYRGEDTKTHVEAVRWTLPEANQQATLNDGFQLQGACAAAVAFVIDRNRCTVKGFNDV